jgi:hypothetical protein
MLSPLTRPPSLAALAAAGLLLFALPDTGVSQTVIPVQAYTLAPNPAPLNTAFTLYLSGESFTCGTVFSRESATVTGKRIDLTFEADSPAWDAFGNDPNAALPICLYDLSASSPVETLSHSRIVPRFKLPALPGGDYEVWVTRAYACQFTEPVCLVKPQIVYAGTLKVPAAPESKPFYVSPNPVAAGKAFTLSALSNRYDCGYTFDHLATVVKGQSISLAFRAQALAGAKCASPVNAYGPAFRLDALAAGKYVVEIAPEFYCPPGFACPLIREVYYDTLVVMDVKPMEGWFLKDHQVAPNKAFTMQLLNNLFGSCQTSFSNHSLTVAKDKISVSFAVETDDERVCKVDIRPYGPAIEMPAMKAGSYPVFVQPLPACLFETPTCLIGIVPNPLPADTLLVSQSTSILISALRAGGLKASFEGAAVGFDLPGTQVAGAAASSSAWRAELLTLQGRRLAAGSVRSKGQARATLPLPSLPGPGIYLLKLQSAAGAITGKTGHTALIIPVVRHD